MPSIVVNGVTYVPAPVQSADMSLLDVVFQCDELDGEVTIRFYLFKLLETLWAEGEGFSGKRPFGNSSWEFDLYRALAKHGAIKATFYPDGGLDSFDVDAANQIIYGLIETMCGVPAEDA